MEYSFKNNDETTEVQLVGRVTFEDNQAFKTIISQSSHHQQCSVILDLLDVKLVDSAGLGLLLRVQSEVEKNDRNVTLRIPHSGPVKRLMDSARFEELIPVVA